MSADFLRRIAALERLVSEQAKQIEQLKALIAAKPRMGRPPNDKAATRSD